MLYNIIKNLNFGPISVILSDLNLSAENRANVVEKQIINERMWE